MASKSNSALYAPVGTVGGILAGLVARKLFTRVWTTVRHEDLAPTPRKPEASTLEVLVAAMLQGAIFYGVRAMFDRQAARVFTKWSGEWPDDTPEVKETHSS